MGTPSHRRLSIGRVALLGLAIVGLAVAFSLGKASGPTGGASPPAPPAPAPSRDSAVSTYLAQQVALGDPGLWRAPHARREQRLNAMLASGSLRRSISSSIDTAMYTGSPLGRALRAGTPVLARSAPLGYRVLSYAPQRARIETWIVSLVGGRNVPLTCALLAIAA